MMSPAWNYATKIPPKSFACASGAVGVENLPVGAWPSGISEQNFEVVKSWPTGSWGGGSRF